MQKIGMKFSTNLILQRAQQICKNLHRLSPVEFSLRMSVTEALCITIYFAYKIVLHRPLFRMTKI